MKKVRLLLDFSVIMRKNYDQYTKMEQDKMDEQFKPFALWRHMIFQAVLELKQAINPDEIIIACDSRSWRKDVYPKYKSNRDYSGLNEYFMHSDNLLEEIKKYFPFKLIKEKGLEGDDIIALFVLQKSNDWINVIGSIDSDLQQLLLYPNTIYFNINEKRTHDLSLEEIKDKLLLKLLKGDAGDGIPNIFTEELVKGTRSKSVTKGFIDDCKENLERVLTHDEELKRRFKRNRQLIFLSKDYIPLDLQEKMWNSYNNYKFGGGQKELFGYMNDWCMQYLKERIEEFKNLW